MILKKHVLLSILLVVALSGCLGGGQATALSNEGVVIKAFEADLTALDGGDAFSLFLDAENVGGAEASNVYALLYGIPMTTSSGSTDSFEIETGEDKPVKLSDSLFAPDSTANLRGDVASKTWDLTAPELPTGVTQPYNPRVRLFYKYSTIATSTVTALTSSEHRRLRERSDAIPDQTQTIVSGGPIGVTINARAPVVIDDFATDRIRLIINVEVLQNGNAFSPGATDFKDKGTVGESELDKVEIKITAPGTDAATGECQAVKDKDTLTLRAGTSATYSCALKTDSFVGRKDIPVRVSLTYHFMTDTSTTITVAGVS
ncbi:MAG: hypothetical protein HYS81_01705 [Candidatus Aenigmatarchaeota archaeon]|nr:MAG: hypothetical protein HYS81_01705 [Candidatus Aenigmarchaeota archaeon]